MVSESHTAGTVKTPKLLSFLLPFSTIFTRRQTRGFEDSRVRCRGNGNDESTIVCFNLFFGFD